MHEDEQNQGCDCGDPFGHTQGLLRVLAAVVHVRRCPASSAISSPKPASPVLILRRPIIVPSPPGIATS